MAFFFVDGLGRRPCGAAWLASASNPAPATSPLGRAHALMALRWQAGPNRDPGELGRCSLFLAALDPGLPSWSSRRSIPCPPHPPPPTPPPVAAPWRALAARRAAPQACQGGLRRGCWRPAVSNPAPAASTASECSAPAAACSTGRSCPGPAAAWPGAARNRAGAGWAGASWRIWRRGAAPPTWWSCSNRGPGQPAP